MHINTKDGGPISGTITSKPPVGPHKIMKPQKQKQLGFFMLIVI